MQRKAEVVLCGKLKILQQRDKETFLSDFEAVDAHVTFSKPSATRVLNIYHVFASKMSFPKWCIKSKWRIKLRRVSMNDG
ncbi:Hypothetical protein DEACI_2670 [Acididesulfobacillus acetoxydans]|uniref:Uncharacterized protein n=1 Tax=Acididesulfobacillus acetoxydans TaxID=1561005 RepID=A0A8S0W8R1_9FIRM|nr:Hypothetical protein DEACI_2670 [Acididesulfobacillus acetoxydans]CEJ08158.1 Hypothetical protein DEACI_2633 [Acididesulfobacillus acetoxydans]